MITLDRKLVWKARDLAVPGPNSRATREKLEMGFLGEASVAQLLGVEPFTEIPDGAPPGYGADGGRDLVVNGTRLQIRTRDRRSGRDLLWMDEHQLLERADVVVLLWARSLPYGNWSFRIVGAETTDQLRRYTEDGTAQRRNLDGRGPTWIVDYRLLRDLDEVLAGGTAETA